MKEIKRTEISEEWAHSGIVEAGNCVFEEAMPPIERRYAGVGRKPYQYIPFLRCMRAKSYFKIGKTQELIQRLKGDPNLSGKDCT